MKKYLWFASACFGLITASCYYDPNYGGSASYGVSSYGSGYSSSVFVSTGDPRWAYDPYRYSYYDRYSSRYYDPYLNGYYPVGYRPVIVRGCPHPYNWSGRGYCPPPRHVRSHTLSNYHNREQYYRSSNQSWSRNVSSSGSGSWMSSSERSQLQKHAQHNDHSNRKSGSSNWNGSPQRQYPGSNYQSSPSPRSSGSMYSQPRSNQSSSWNQRDNPSQTRNYIHTQSTPSIQPRPTSGGMFGGMDRSGRQPQGNGPSIQSRGQDRTPPPPTMERSSSSRRESSPPEQKKSKDDDGKRGNDRHEGNRYERFQR